MLDVENPDDIIRFTQGNDSVCVNVSVAKGSTPRLAGTCMLVNQTTVLGTIGGGQLEYMAIDAARSLLASQALNDSLSVPLGPAIGQCCGGHVTLTLERVTPSMVETLYEQTKSAIRNNPAVYLFGAGHVGRALGKALLSLPVRPILIDQRSEELALSDPALTTDCTPVPETHISQAPAGSAFVILTHDHALDFMLAYEALGRAHQKDDVAYVGMIGSQTKRATFTKWIKQLECSDQRIEHLTMPIGTSKLTDKRPAVIATMVAAEVMEAVGLWQNDQASQMKETV